MLQAKRLGELGLNYLSLCQLRSEVIDKDEFMKILTDKRARSKPLREKSALLVPSHSKFISCFVVPLLHSIVFVSLDRDMRETIVSRDVIWWQTRNKAVTDPHHLFRNCSSPGIVFLSPTKPPYVNSKVLCFASATRFPAIEKLNRAH